MISWTMRLLWIQLVASLNRIYNARYPTRTAIAIIQTFIFICIAILMTGVGVLGFALTIPFALLWGLEAVINSLERRYDRLTQQRLKK
mgnify:CR=1